MKIRKGRRRKSNFNPGSDFLKTAVDNFLQKGGGITRVEKLSYKEFMAIKMDYSSMSLVDPLEF